MHSIRFFCAKLMICPNTLNVVLNDDSQQHTFTKLLIKLLIKLFSLMKKIILLAAFVLASTSSIWAQEFKIGVGGALPSGDVKDSYTFGINADFSYLFEVSDNFTAGPMAGVMHYFGDSIDLGGFGSVDVDDATFVPLGGTGRLVLGESFVLGASLGYGLGIAPDGNDGGFYYKPISGYMVSDAVSILASYTGVSFDGGTFSSLNLGIEFGL